MKLKAVCSLSVHAPSACPMIAMLRPRSGLTQRMISERYELQPPVPVDELVDGYGNFCQRLVLQPGPTHILVESTMEVEAEIAVALDAPPTPVTELPANVLHYLLQSRYCPSDVMLHRALSVVGNAAPGYAQVEKIRAWIHGTLHYRYGVSSASTDALDTLAHGAGVCRDFAHVGIALCRSLRIPARMVVGYLHGLKPMDLHAWFEAFVGGRWYTFDATQSVPRGGRIVLAYGHDAADVAFISDYGVQPLELVGMRVEVSAPDEERERRAAPGRRTLPGARSLAQAGLPGGALAD